MMNKFGAYSKYHNTKVSVKGEKVASTIEAKALIYYQKLEREKKLHNLEAQTKYILQKSFRCSYWNGKSKSNDKRMHRAITYAPDFRFTMDYKGKIYIVIVEIKGFVIDVYKIKKKLFLERYGKDIIFLEIHGKKQYLATLELAKNLIDEREKEQK